MKVRYNMRLLQENTRILTVDVYTKGSGPIDDNGIISEWIESLSFDITNDDYVQDLYATNDDVLTDYFKTWFENSFFYKKYANRNVFMYQFSCKFFK